MPKYAIIYRVTIAHEAVVEAKTKKQAIEKVKEVIGEPFDLEGSWEVRSEDKTNA